MTARNLGRFKHLSLFSLSQCLVDDKSKSHVPCLSNNDIVKRRMPVAESRETNPDHHVESID